VPKSALQLKSLSLSLSISQSLLLVAADLVRRAA
jgi:hypothetical protein